MDYRLVYTPAEIHDYIDGEGVVAFDFETAPDDAWRDEPKAALDPHMSHIVGMSMSVAEESAVYVPLAHKVGSNANEPDAIMQYLRDALFENPAVIKVAHNLAFEAMFLYALGIVVCEPCYDTIAAAQLTLKSRYEFRDLHDSGLKLLSTTLFHAEMPDFTTVTAGRHFDEMNPAEQETLRYACADSDYTLRLYHKFNDWFDRYLPKHRYIVEHIESPTAVYVGMMKYNGVPVDVPTMLKKKKEAEAKLVKLRSDIAFMIGDVDIGANASTSAFKQYLYKDLGLPVLKTTTKYQEAAEDEAMILLREWCATNKPELTQLFDLIQEYRKWGKLKSTYIDGYLRFVSSADGRIHPDLMPLATETGRFACRAPNLQNQCAPGADPIGIRNFIVAPDGWKLIEADYSQVEARLAAYLSYDKTMLDAYANNEDIHAITTSAVFGIPIEEAADKHNPQYKLRRTVAKSTMFGILYGIYARGLSRNLKTNAGLDYTEQECKQYIQGIKERYTGLAKWQTDAVGTARNNMFSETELGRRRYIPNIRSTDFGKRSGAERMALNTPVQGLAADCLKHGMALLVRALADKPYIRPIMTVHDSLVFEVEDTHIEEASRVIRECMEAKPLPEMPQLIAEVAVGQRYGELE